MEWIYLIWNTISKHFDVICNVTSFLINIILFIIAIYTFYKTFLANKIKFCSYSVSGSSFNGDSIHVVIKNETLTAICISKINLIIENHYRITIEKYDEPIVLEPLKTLKVSTDPYSYIANVNSNINMPENKYLEIITVDKKIISKFLKMRIDKKATHEICTIIRKTYNGLIVMPGFKYALIYWENNMLHTVFINNGGLMSKELFGFNAIPLDILTDINKVKHVFDEYFSKYNMTFHLEKINGSGGVNHET